MNITCDNCQSRFKIPEEKIPEEGQAVFRCPKCRGRIVIPAAKAQKAAPTLSDGFSFDPVSYDESDKAFDFIEEEGKIGLVCEPSDENFKTIKGVLELMEHHVTRAESSMDALKKLQYHTYDVVVINEAFDTPPDTRNRVQAYIAQLPMGDRRDTMVALITERFKTMDSMAAFNNSVNLVVHPSAINGIGRILERSIAENTFFFQAHADANKKIGR